MGHGRPERVAAAQRQVAQVVLEDRVPHGVEVGRHFKSLGLHLWPHTCIQRPQRSREAVPNSSLLVCVSAPPAAPPSPTVLTPTHLRHEAANARRGRAPAREHGAQLAAHRAAQLVQPALGERRRGAAFRAAFRVLRVAEGRRFLQQPLL